MRNMVKKQTLELEETLIISTGDADVFVEHTAAGVSVRVWGADPKAASPVAETWATHAELSVDDDPDS